MLSSTDETLRRYCTVSGRMSSAYVNYLNYYQISDPNSEILLQYVIWEDYRQKNLTKIVL